MRYCKNDAITTKILLRLHEIRINKMIEKQILTRSLNFYFTNHISFIFFHSHDS